LSLALDGYSITETLRKDDEFMLRRGRRDSDGKSVLILTTIADHPATAASRHVDSEYAIRTELDPAWAAQPLALIQSGEKKSLILTDSGGVLLDKILDQPLELSLFLKIAIGIAGALRQLHQHEIVHKDIHPGNILVDPETGDVHLLGFGIASRIPREHQSLVPLEVIDGTFPYMAPEQTGRMNRSVDSRSDLYSLGVTLYQLLTGQLPFVAVDPMEWVHCHIARQPVAPSKRRPALPEVLSAIVMKLLAKTAEARYQTAEGLRADLNACLQQWSATGKIESFALGSHDTSGQLLIPEKLYGREEQRQTLLNAVDRVVMSGMPEIVMISGYSGIGKSSLVSELYKAIVQPRALFISGKFDQYKRNIPYATLAQAFQVLVRQILSQDEEKLEAWRAAVMQAVGDNGQLIVDIIPELKFVIGEQEPVTILPSSEAQNRFQMVFRQFLGVFARAEHPLILFLDDLQWVDAASLKLIEYLVTQSSVNYFLLIGSYRDNEVGLAHPLKLKLDTIRKSGAVVNDIVLAPLVLKDVSQLIADTITCDLADAAPLAQLVFDKTGGNPFFTIQFLNELAAERLLAFNEDEARWTWDIDRIHAKGFADNIIDLMIAKLRMFQESTLAVLKVLACLGHSADVDTIAMACDKSPEAIHDHLWPALRVGILVRQNNTYLFQHDRLQEAAYLLIESALLPKVHLKIGRLALQHLSQEAIEEQLFDIVNHLNRGLSQMTENEEKARLCELNRSAGMKAKAGIAHAAAQHYLTQARSLLPDDAWTTDFEKTFSLYLALAESEYLISNFEQADEVFNFALHHASDNVDRAKVKILQSALYQSSGTLDKAVVVSLEALKLVGIDMPSSEAEINSATDAEWENIERNMRGRKIADLIDSPDVTDPHMKTMLDAIMIAISPFYIAHPSLYPVATLKALNMSLLYGITETSCTAFSSYSVLLVSEGKISDAAEFSELSLRLNQKYHDTKGRGRLLYLHGVFVNIWRRPFSTTIPILEEAFISLLNNGNLPFAGYCSYIIPFQLFEMNQPLDELQSATKKYLNFAHQHRNEVAIQMIRMIEQVAACMMGLTEQEGRLDDKTYSEIDALGKLNKAGFGSGIARFYIMKQWVAFMYGQYDEALASAAQASGKLQFIRSTLQEATHHFYHALTLAALYPNVAPSEQKKFMQILREKAARLKIWADGCPENHLNRYALVAAEIARIEGRNFDAMRLYDEAIESAHASGFSQNEGMANELAASFYHQLGFGKIATIYLREARHCFLKWGATGKVKQLDQRFSIFDTGSTKSVTSSSGVPVEHLDMLSVVKASQAVSGVIVLETLIETLLHIVIENAGAERGLLILPQEKNYRIEAEGKTDQSGVQVTFVHAAMTSQQLPESVLQYAIRTREKVLLADAGAPSQFSDDPYVHEHRPKSVLCMPLTKQGKLVGVLYLENKLTPGVFTPDRIAVLELLASQAAISIENATLYHDLREENSERKRAELALEAYRDQLELTIKERTNELVRQNVKLEEAYRALEEVSLTDQLTGLRNRRFLMQNLEPDISMYLRRHEEWMKRGTEAIESNIDIVFFIVDLDHFKAVNDEYGHAAGDEVLIQIRERLQEVFRITDYLIRWGGEEFLVVARETNRDAAPIVAERIRMAFSGREFSLPDGVKVSKTCSVGFACFPFFREKPRLLSWSQVIELADQGLYRAKHGGRNAWVGLLGGECSQEEGAFDRLKHSADQATQSGELTVISSKNRP
jgi:diguanylate cyclase (GGDEF)-like protein